jgi:hypothetical protein
MTKRGTPDTDTYLGTTHHVEIGELDFYVTFSHVLHPTSYKPQLIRITIVGPRTDDDTRCLMAGVAGLINLCLDKGIDVDTIAQTLIHMHGRTGGLTNDPLIPTTSSILDYIAKLMTRKYGREHGTTEQLETFPDGDAE